MNHKVKVVSAWSSIGHTRIEKPFTLWAAKVEVDGIPVKCALEVVMKPITTRSTLSATSAHTTKRLHTSNPYLRKHKDYQEIRKAIIDSVTNYLHA